MHASKLSSIIRVSKSNCTSIKYINNRLMVKSLNTETFKTYITDSNKFPYKLPQTKHTVEASYLKGNIKFHSTSHSITDMLINEKDVPSPWGPIKTQIFGDHTRKNATPIIAVHGWQDNSNSFRPIAPYLCRDEYYIISIDLPGHGLCSRLPDGIPYTPKLFISSIRRVVKYYELDKFIFLAHSYGCLLALLYDTVFQDELKAIIAIDWIFGYTSRKWSSHSYYWKEGIDGYLKLEKEFKNKIETKQGKEPLTPELASKILLKANHHLDETAAKVLIERGLKKDHQGNYMFSRDPNMQNSMKFRDHYLDLMLLWPEVKKYLAAPTLMIHADPPSYGKQSLDDTLGLIDQLNKESKTKIECEIFKGTHHFHMIKPKETAIRILQFLDKLRTTPSIKI